MANLERVKLPSYEYSIVNRVWAPHPPPLRLGHHSPRNSSRKPKTRRCCMRNQDSRVNPAPANITVHPTTLPTRCQIFLLTILIKQHLHFLSSLSPPIRLRLTIEPCLWLQCFVKTFANLFQLITFCFSRHLFNTPPNK